MSSVSHSTWACGIRALGVGAFFRLGTRGLKSQTPAWDWSTLRGDWPTAARSGAASQPLVNKKLYRAPKAQVLALRLRVSELKLHSLGW